MKPIRYFAAVSLLATIVSCSNSPKAGGEYDTSNPYGVPDYEDTTASGGGDTYSNPIYDTPAAYEEAGDHTPAPDTSIVDPGLSAPRSTESRTAAASASATTHVVVKGDTLGGISRKYGVPMAAIKKANNMKNDIVVLGRTLKIPAR